MDTENQLIHFSDQSLFVCDDQHGSLPELNRSTSVNQVFQKPDESTFLYDGQFFVR